MHYQRWRSTGDPGPAAMVRQPQFGSCAVEGCGQPARKRGWCAAHYAQQWQTGIDPVPFRYKWYGDGIGYVQAHRRVRNARGHASQHRCIDCGGQAAEWSYDYSDPDERKERGRSAYSLDVNRYEPRCVRCHRFADDNPIACRRFALGRAGRRGEGDGR
jgi:hypothetical protein